MRRVHVVVEGTVQGVGYRWATRRELLTHDLAGWVRNLADGTVEAEFEGEGEGIDPVVAWMRSGPRGAAVRRISVTELEPTGERGVEIR